MNRRAGYALLIPVLVFLLLQIVATASVVRLSFSDSNIIKSKFVGLQNYIEYFTDPRIGGLFVNSVLYAILMIFINAAIGITVALSIYDFRKGLRNAVLFSTYLPAFSSGIIISSVWRWIYAYPTGLANWFLSLVGMAPVVWMQDRWMAIVGVVINIGLTSSGGCVLFITAACMAIPKELFDAAHVDGAGPMTIRMRIVMPLIMPMISMVILISLISSFQVWETIYMMSPVVEANNLMYDMYFTAFRFGRYGMGATKSVMLMLIIVVLSLVKRKVEKQ
jgi:multiple sugar transport system permease protein